MANQDTFAPGDGLRNADILYVDEDAHRRENMRRILLSLGARRVQLADSGQNGLRVFTGADIGLVVVEHRMQAMDGITFIRRIRAASLFPKAIIPALLIGDSIGPEIARAALAAGANHVLVKPVGPGALYDRLDWALRDTRPFAVQDGHYVIRRTPIHGAAKPAASGGRHGLIKLCLARAIAAAYSPAASACPAIRSSSACLSSNDCLCGGRARRLARW